MLLSALTDVLADMHYPQKYGRALATIFGFVTFVDITAAVIGYPMYANQTNDEVATNVLDIKTYLELSNGDYGPWILLPHLCHTANRLSPRDFHRPDSATATSPGLVDSSYERCSRRHRDSLGILASDVGLE
jgi:hypothetical protein